MLSSWYNSKWSYGAVHVQMCLFDTLKNTESRDTRKFWFYKKYFQQNCKTNEQNFNAVCSEKVRLQSTSADA